MTFGLASLLNKQDTIKANVLHSIDEQNLPQVASPYAPSNMSHHLYRSYKYKDLKHILIFPPQITWRHYDHSMLTKWNTMVTQH